MAGNGPGTVLVTSWEATLLKKRRFNVRRMTLLAISGRPCLGNGGDIRRARAGTLVGDGKRGVHREPEVQLPARPRGVRLRVAPQVGFDSIT